MFHVKQSERNDFMFINWNVIPFNFNNSYPNLLWTTSEWIGKLAYIIDDHEGRINNLTERTEALETVVTNFETRINNLEDYRNNILVPFFTTTLPTLITHDFIETFYYNKEYIDKTNNVNLAMIADNSRQIEALRNDLDRNSKVNYYSYSVPTPSSTGGHNVYTLDKYDGYSVVNLSIIFADHFVLNVFVPTSSGSSRSAINLNNSIINISVANDTIIISVDNTTITSIDAVYYTGVHVPTPDEKIELFNKADTNGDGVINPVDASALLTFYTTCQGGTYTNDLTGWINFYNEIYGTDPVHEVYPDVNGDGIVDPRDASLIMTFYQGVSSGKYENTADDFYEFMNEVI